LLQSTTRTLSLLFGLLLCAGLVFLSPVTTAAVIEGMRIWRAPDHTRIVLDLSGPVEHVIAPLANPERLVLDITGAALKADPNQLPLADTPVAQIRTAVQNQTDVRIVFDLKTKVQPRSFLLKPFAGNSDRLVLDLYDIVPEQQPAATASVKTPAATTATGNIPVPAVSPQAAVKTQAAVNGERDIIIAIDAGHGGEDPGAIGPKRLREKDVTLAISKELVAAINAERGFTAKLVRTGDYFIPLKKRRDIARNMQADLFVSIHADAFHKSSARGASVFALSRHGATSETARFLAQRENEADLIGGVGGISLEDKDEMLAGVLVDLSMTATLNSSLQVGNHVLNSMGTIARLHKNHVEQAGFMVLKSPDVPSILVETGFISNPEEAAKLASPAYRKQMAQAVFKGVRQYFVQHPPAGTYIAAQQGAGSNSVREHVIAPGDTLTAIAQRYNVSVSQLLSHNGMKSHVIKVGQTLKIPAS
jgi:N-acetylmuramoyl-L-alanine amidase